ncbi:hypothetical protein CRE_00635 [Caenorhabditis remanei]|uniref:Uncharacterized protein n=1 Tax=Caenorhabditis remanei TaxID=31234 RepID=E3LDK1_CAERE|nr:hypothetical protein CRE_00635 [Caenorhabditis remanei]
MLAGSAASRFFEHDPELAAIFQEPVTKRIGVVEYQEKPRKGFYRHEILKTYMRRYYPTPSMRSDLIDSMNVAVKFNIPTYFTHQPVDKKQNMQKAQNYLQYLGSTRGFICYFNRASKSTTYRHVIERMRYSFRCYIKELNGIYQRAEHVHFLNEIIFIKNLQTYPFPKRWIVLIAFYHNMPEYERLLAAIRVLTDYDGDRAPEFEAEMF